MLLRRLLQLAFALALVVVGASSTLRLAANGIGCAPWPACYGQAATAQAANREPLARSLRIAHRIAAGSFALVALGAVALGWRGWPSRARAAGVALLGLTALLAAVGRYTPSPIPAVTIANLLGGCALLGLLAYLLACGARRPAEPGGALRKGLAAVAAALALQAGTGALISARLAGAACASGCSSAWLPGATALAHPWRPGTAADLVHPRAGQVLHVGHRLFGLLLALVAVVAGLTVVHRADAGVGAALAIAAAAAAGLGFGVAAGAPSLAAAALHALAAALLCAALGAAFALRSGPPLKESQS